MSVQFRRPKVTDKSLDLSTFVRMQETLEALDGMAFSQDFTIQRLAGGRKGIMLTPGVGAMDYSKFCLGFSISGAKVTVAAGEVQWAEHDPVEVASVEKDLTVDYQYIGVEFDGTTFTILDPDVDKTKFKSADGKFRTWLYQFRLVAGAASLHRIGCLMNIMIPARFGN
jgi:hypothetical protein